LTINLFSEIIIQRLGACPAKPWRSGVIIMAESKGTGLSKNTESALCYVLPVVGGVIFLVMEKDAGVRFHAMQSIVFSVAAFALNMVLGFTIVLALVLPILWVVEFILWLVLVYKAWQGETWELPVLGKLARQLLAKA
jgi:uncharacterized membrane protein